MKDLKNKKDIELTTMITEKRKALREYRFNISGSNIRNTKHAKNIKKDIARILTEINTR